MGNWEVAMLERIELIKSINGHRALFTTLIQTHSVSGKSALNCVTVSAILLLC